MENSGLQNRRLRRVPLGYSQLPSQQMLSQRRNSLPLFLDIIQMKTTTEINWLTAEQVRTEAEKGPKEALAITKLHWLQMSEATLEQLEAKFEIHGDLYDYISGDFCGLCLHYRWGSESVFVNTCPLFSSKCCCQEWKDVYYLSITLSHSVTLSDIYPDFHEKSGILYEKIKGLE